MPLTFHIAAQETGGSPRALKADVPFVNIPFEFEQLPPVHEVMRACEAIFSFLLTLTTTTSPMTARAGSGATQHDGFLVETLLFFDEFRLCWCELISAVQLHPGIQLCCLSPTQCSALPPPLHNTSVQLLQSHGKHLFPEPDLTRVVTWPSTVDRAQTLAALRTSTRPRPALQSTVLSSKAPAPAPPTDRSLYEEDGEGRTFSTRVREVFTALDREQRAFLLLRDFYDFAARYTLPCEVLNGRRPSVRRQRASNASASTTATRHSTSVPPSEEAALSPYLDENLARLFLDAHQDGPPSRGRSHLHAPTETAMKEDLALTRTCDFDAIIRAADTDRDGRLSFAEWTNYCLTHPRVLALFDLHLHPSSLQSMLSRSPSSPSSGTAEARGVRAAAPRSGSRGASESAAPPGRTTPPATVVSAAASSSRSSETAKSSTTASREPVSQANRSDETVRQEEAMPTREERVEAAHPYSDHQGRSTSARMSLASRAPSFMQPGHSSHRCYFRKCSACAAAKCEEEKAHPGRSSTRGSREMMENPHSFRPSRLPWNYRSGRTSLVPQDA